MQAYPAERTEILRTERKDEDYEEELYQRLSNVLKSVAGDAAWIQAYKWLRPIAKLLYYSTTTLHGIQTLGQQYMSLIPVRDQNGRLEASFLQRLFYVLLEAFGAVAVDQKLNDFKQADEIYYQNAEKRPPIGRVILSTLLKSLSFATIQRLHWAFFYLMGSKFYSIWKRIANIQYLSLRPETNVRMHIVFKVIGATALLGFILELGFKIRREILRQKRLRPAVVSGSTVPEKDGHFFCDICLNAGEPVSTPCGHVFCFDCIIFHSEHVGLETNQGQCPQCRFKFKLRHVIPLMNL